MTKALPLACLLLPLALPARAELKAGHRYVSIGVGSGGHGTSTDWRALGGDKEADYKGGSAFGAQYLYQLTPNLGLGGEFEFSNYGQKDHTLTSYTVRMGGEVYTAEAVMRYTFLPHKWWRPFLAAGFGVSSQRVYALTTPRAGVTWPGTGTRETRSNYSTTLNGASASLGLGLEADLNERFTAGLDLRVRSRAVDKTVVDSALGGTHDFAPDAGASLLLRLGYRFGGADQAGFIK
jgi:hypothetical protein